MESIGLYIHIPFCRQKCLYCDFPSWAGREGQMQMYVDALTAEIRAQGKRYENREVVSVFFGGGTPTALEIPMLAQLMQAIRESFRVTADAELTTEANPGTLSYEMAAALKKMGFNRLSMGVQAWQNSILHRLGRIHTIEEFLENYHAVRQAGFENVNFYNPDGALGYRPDDSYFAGKGITVSRLRNWELEDVSKLDVTEAVAQSKQVGFDRIQMLQDDNKRWAMYIKPEGQQAFSIYPDKADLNRFFSTLKQAQDTLDSLRVELAQKYYAMAAMKPDLKVDLFGHQTQDLDINRIQKVNVFKTKEDVILCAATIDGVPDLKPRAVSPSQWQRMWLAEDKNDYKTHLAATLFADVLKKGQSLEENANEKQDKETEQKQGESAVVKQSEETKKEVKAEEEEKPREETKAEPSLILKQYLDLKKKHPDAVLLFRCGDFYETYMQDAEKASRILGITLTKSSKTKDPEGKPLAMAGFPYHALDSYLPKLIRAGERVAICDQLAPRQEQQKSQSEQREQETQQSHMKR